MNPTRKRRLWLVLVIYLVVTAAIQAALSLVESPRFIEVHRLGNPVRMKWNRSGIGTLLA